MNASGMSRYAICKAMGFNQGAMSRFMSGKAGSRSKILDRLAEVIGMEIVTKPKPERETKG